MTATIHVGFTILSFGLVAVSLVLAWVLNIVFGGFKIGRLARRVEVAVVRNQLPAFLETFHRRLAELGFKPGEAANRFVQRGAAFGDLSSFTHAKTPKQLELVVHESGPNEQRVELSLRYLDVIVGDTGESAYADAVLAYVSGQADGMKRVANRSFMAFCCLVGGIWMWVAVLGMRILRVEPFFAPLLTLGITNIASGILAVIVISMKPGELQGVWLAVGGIVASVLALAAALAVAAW